MHMNLGQNRHVTMHMGSALRCHTPFGPHTAVNESQRRFHNVIFSSTLCKARYRDGLQQFTSLQHCCCGFQVDNNEGLDYKLKLVDAPTEEQILDRRAREFAAAERDRLAQIAQAEAEISKEVAAEREDAEGDAMHEWWRVRRSDLRQHAIEMVQQEMGGGGEGCADEMEVRLHTALLSCWLRCDVGSHAKLLCWALYVEEL